MTIGEVCRQTGLSADVVRVWERRYRAVAPSRLGSGRRSYSGSDLRRLMLLRDAVAAGHTISAIAALDDGELCALAGAGGDDDALVADLIARVARHDAEGLESALQRIAASRPAEAFCDGVLSPLLEEVGAYWLHDRSLIAKEHLTSSIVARVLERRIASAPPATGPVLVFATIPHDRHVVGALMAAFVAAHHGFQTLVLGAGTTPAELADVARRLKARGVGVSLVYQEAAHTVQQLAALLTPIPLWTGGAKAPGSVQRFTSMREFAAMLDEL